MAVVELTDNAANKVRHLLDVEGRDDLALRVQCQAGGCSGIIYQLYFDERRLDGDTVEEFATTSEPVRVVIDKMTIPYVINSVIDYSDTIEVQGFNIDNPNATSTCACGDSFH